MGQRDNLLYERLEGGHDVFVVWLEGYLFILTQHNCHEYNQMALARSQKFKSSVCFDFHPPHASFKSPSLSFPPPPHGGGGGRGWKWCWGRPPVACSGQTHPHHHHHHHHLPPPPESGSVGLHPEGSCSTFFPMTTDCNKHLLLYSFLCVFVVVVACVA